MRINSLPSPGLLSNGIKLRVESAKAISSVEMTCARTPGGKTTSAKALSDFYQACVDSLATLFDVTAATITAQVATSATVLTLTFSETMDTGVIPAMSAFAITGDTFTSAVWTNGTTLTITGTGFAAAESLTYTKPAVNALRDRAGNQVATVAGLILA